MKKIRIGLLTEIINGHSGSRAPLEIGKHLAILGHNVTTYAYDTMRDVETEKNLQRDRVKIVTFTQNKTPIIGKYISAVFLYKILRKDKPEVLIFAGTLPFFLAGKLSGIPIIRLFMGIQLDALLENKSPDEKTNIFDTLINQLGNLVIYLTELISFKLSSKIVAISKFAAKQGERLFSRKVDCSVYLGATSLLAKNVIQTPKKYITVISVSRITPYKGFHFIINALKKINSDKKIKFTIVGSQPKKNYIKYLKKIGGEMVRIIIDPTDGKLAKLYQRSDIYACGDKYLYFGLPIMEAAQFDIPTVSMDLAAAKELIDHGKTGFIAKTPEEFRNYLQILIENDQFRQKLGQNAKLKTLFFSWKRCAKQYEKIIKKTLQ